MNTFLILKLEEGGKRKKWETGQDSHTEREREGGKRAGSSVAV